VRRGWVTVQFVLLPAQAPAPPTDAGTGRGASASAVATVLSPEQGLFWAPWRGLSSASRPCLGLLWDGGNSRPTRMYFARCGFELCLNLDRLHGLALGSESFQVGIEETSAATRNYFATTSRCGFELCLNLELCQ
jgi:hypothetical protein